MGVWVEGWVFVICKVSLIINWPKHTTDKMNILFKDGHGCMEIHLVLVPCLEM